MNSEELKAHLRTILSHVLEDNHSTETTYSKYFSTDYIQHVDGKTFNYTQFVAHMAVLKATMLTMRVDFKHLIVEDNQIVSIHHVHGVKVTGEEIEAKVIAFFNLDGGKIILCDELTYLIKGTEKDKDLGSRH